MMSRKTRTILSLALLAAVFGYRSLHSKDASSSHPTKTATTPVGKQL